MTQTTATGQQQSTARPRVGADRHRVVAAIVATLVAVVAAGGSGVAAEGPAATITASAAAAPAAAAPPQRLGAAKPAAGQGGLAAFAARAELKGTTNEAGKIAISNDSLSATSGGGTLSVGGGVSASTGSAGPQPESDTPGAPPASELWDKSFAEQQKKVDSLEKDLADFDHRVASGKDPYTSNSTQNRAPGQVDPGILERERAAKLIAAEKAKLDEMKRQARREGAATPRK